MSLQHWIQINIKNPVQQHKQQVQQLHFFSTLVVTGFLQNWQVRETGFVPKFCAPVTTWTTCGWAWLTTNSWGVARGGPYIGWPYPGGGGPYIPGLPELG